MLRAAEGGGVAARAGYKVTAKMWAEKPDSKKRAYSTCWQFDSFHGDAYGVDQAPEEGDDYLTVFNYDSCCWTGEDSNGNSQEGKGTETCWDDTPIEGGPKKGKTWSFKTCCEQDWSLADCKYSKEEMEEQFRNTVVKGVTCEDKYGLTFPGGKDCPDKCRKLLKKSE